MSAPSAADGDAAAAAADAAAADAGDTIDATGVSVLSSLCVVCEARGETRLLMLKIPFFRDIILAAFNCEACGACPNPWTPHALPARPPRHRPAAALAVGGAVAGLPLRSGQTSALP